MGKKDLIFGLTPGMPELLPDIPLSNGVALYFPFKKWPSCLPPLLKGGRGDSFAKALLALTVSVFFLLCPSFPAKASWLIDPKKFHASVHGQFSCQDCHEGVGEGEVHPSPADILKKQTDFFDVERCLACHDGVLDALEDGTHGTRNVENPDRYRKCYQCHEPHTQTPLRETGGFDPARPRHEQCGVCHEEKKTLPPLAEEDAACMQCHQTFGPGDEERIRAVCFHCHGKGGTQAREATAERVSLIDTEAYDSTVHANLGCTECHPQAILFNHGEQEFADCTRCHMRHDEKVAHDLHASVACGACHLGGVKPVRDASQRVVWKRAFSPEKPSQVHDMVAQFDDAACRRCHNSENRVGASAMLLPPKSILCMPCHAATFSAGDTITVVTLLAFAFGLFLIGAYVLTGSRSGKAGERLEHGQRGRIAKALLFDVLVQRRLYLQSKKRWVIHGLIFYPFLFRFLWGIVGLIGSLLKPNWPWVWAMLDKNHPVSAFLFDLTGLMIIIGVVLALIRGADKKTAQSADFPKQDRIALVLIGAVVVVGFLLESMRISMTGCPPGCSWAFIGYPLAVFWSGPALTDMYGYVWYSHALLTGAFIAYIPFSRLAHIIIAPVVLALNAARGH